MMRYNQIQLAARQRAIAILPALAALAIAVFAAATVWLTLKVQNQNQQIAELRTSQEKLEAAQADPQETQRLRAQAQELERLRKDNQEIHKLRNDARQAREDKKRLEQLLVENQTLRTQIDQLRQAARTPPPLVPSAPGVIPQPGVPPAQAFDPVVNTCKGNLRLIEGAIQRWAAQYQRGVGSPVAAEEIRPFLPNQTMPLCPAGGTYILPLVGNLPTCNISGHNL